MEELTKEIIKYQDLKYQAFTKRLNPTLNPDSIIGVRVPQIRKVTKEYLKTNDGMDFLNQLPHSYLEENIAHGEIIKSLQDINLILDYIDKFLPYADNWEVTDNLNCKIFNKYPKEAFKYIHKWLKSKKTFTLRYGIVALLQFAAKEYFNIEDFILVNNIKSSEYYVNIAIAWYNSVILIYHYDEIIKYFEEGKFDKWIHNKSIQKALESYRIDDQKKNYLRTLRK